MPIEFTILIVLVLLMSLFNLVYSKYLLKLTQRKCDQVKFAENSIKRKIEKARQIYDKTSLDKALTGELGEYKRGYYNACLTAFSIIDSPDEQENNQCNFH